MTQPSAFEQFQQFLEEMFQYDNNALDFGLFKILRLKRNCIEQCITGEPEHLIHFNGGQVFGPRLNIHSPAFPSDKPTGLSAI